MGHAAILATNMLPDQNLSTFRAVSVRGLTTTYRVGLLALALLGLTVPCAFAGHKVKEPMYKHTDNVIQSVDAGAHTVTVATQTKEVPVHPGKAEEGAPHTTNTVTYKVTSTTEIEVSGQKSELSALRAGMKVDVTKGMDESVASRLVAH